MIRALIGKVFLIFVTWLAVVPIGVAESLYSVDNYRPLAADNKGFSVGETVTIIIVENSQAESNNATSAQSNVSLIASLGKSSKTERGSIDIGAGQSGEGATTRGGNFRAQITATIESIDDSGNLQLVGIQKIRVNGEDQLIKVSGSIRSIDIAPNNTVLSTRLSNAIIEYDGDGIANESKRKGIFYWFVSKLGLI